MKKIIFLGFITLFILAGCIGAQQAKLAPEEAKAKVVEFINKNLMQPGNEVSIKEITEENGLYKVVVNTANGQEIDSYMTQDGKYFFPQVMDIAEIESQAQADQDQSDTQAVTAANVPKAEKASVELFVMSHCPYGTQMEKGLLPVLETLGDKVDFELKFCDYAMHGQKELDEELNQYCIQKNEPEKLASYLTCFLADGDGERCLGENKINVSRLNSCVASADSEYKVSELFADQSTWRGGSYPQFNIFAEDNAKYGVSGSPSLVINGQLVSSGRDSATLLSTICAGYDNPPEECNTELASATPSPGFGFSASAGAASTGECN